MMNVMKIDEEKKKELEQIYQSLLNDPRILKMKEIPMHRGSNCYEHSFKVTKIAILHASKHKKINLKEILYACVLHDYYLYDWRKDKTKKIHHGSRHPFLAAEKAEEDFGISPIVKKAIASHMWPLNITNFPSSEEARILSFFDKVVATREALTSKKYKEKNREKYLKFISKLFD